MQLRDWLASSNDGRLHCWLEKGRHSYFLVDTSESFREKAARPGDSRHYSREPI